jgi:hypothetical protein
VPTNTSSNPRVDRLVLRRDLVARTVVPTVLQGTPAASPEPPALTQTDDGLWDLPLHRFTVPANSGAPITGAVDERLPAATYALGAIADARGTVNTATASSAEARLTGSQNVTDALLHYGRQYVAVLASGVQSAAAGRINVNLRMAPYTPAVSDPAVANWFGYSSAAGAAGAQLCVTDGQPFTPALSQIYHVHAFANSVTSSAGAVTLIPTGSNGGIFITIYDRGPATADTRVI